MSRHWPHLMGAASMLLTALMWLALLSADTADRLVDAIVGAQYEYKFVFSAGVLAVALAGIAAVRGARFWYVAVAFSLATVGLFAYAVSA